MSPKTTLTSAAMNDEPKLMRSALSVRGDVAIRQMILGRDRCGLEEEADDRNEDDQAQIEQCVAEGQPEAWNDVRFTAPPRLHGVAQGQLSWKTRQP